MLGSDFPGVIAIPLARFKVALSHKSAVLTRLASCFLPRLLGGPLGQ